MSNVPQQNQRREHRSPLPPREVVKDFTDHASKITVRVNMLPSHPFPQYSLLIGTTMEDGRVLPFVRAFRENSLAAVNFIHDYNTIVGHLTVQAFELVRTMMEADVKKHIDARYEKDLASANRGKAATRHTGKTEKNRNKGK